MIVLAIESATIGVGAAVVDGKGALAYRSVESGRLQTETLHPLIDQVMGESGITMDDIDVIAVDIGPGLFTGLRVGVASAKGLAFGLGVPVVAITSTEALLAGVRFAEEPDSSGSVSNGPDSNGPDSREPSSAGRAIAIVDMRRGEVAFALDARPDAPRLCSPEECAEALSRADGIEGAVVVGDGLSRYEAAFAKVVEERGLVVDSSIRFADAREIGALAIEPGRTDRRLDELVPLYLRAPDARINWISRDLSKVRTS